MLLLTSCSIIARSLSLSNVCLIIFAHLPSSLVTLPQLRVAADQLERNNLDSNLEEFKKFHGARKFRAAVKTVIAIKRMSRALSGASDAGDDFFLEPSTPKPRASDEKAKERSAKDALDD